MKDQFQILNTKHQLWAHHNLRKQKLRHKQVIVNRKVEQIKVNSLN